MPILWLIAIGNLIVWGVIVGLLFLVASREKGLVSDLTKLEGRLGEKE